MIMVKVIDVEVLCRSLTIKREGVAEPLES